MNLKCLPYSATETVAIASVDPISITPAERAIAPYAPGNVRVNGDLWPDGKSYFGNAVLTWANRIRTAQAGGAIVQQDAASTPGTVEGGYEVDVYVNGILMRNVGVSQDNSYTYLISVADADNPGLVHPIQFGIRAVSGANQGSYRVTDPFYLSH